MKRAVQSAMASRRRRHSDQFSGRLGGAENRADGMVSRRSACPAHPARRYRLRVATAFTTFGTCGVKVWIFKGEILEHDPMAQDKKNGRRDNSRPRRDAA